MTKEFELNVLFDMPIVTSCRISIQDDDSSFVKFGLFDKFILWSGSIYTEEHIDEQDKSLGTKIIKREWDCVYRRDKLSMADVTYVNGEKGRYMVSLDLEGVAQPICIYFLRSQRSLAYDILDKIKSYIQY